MLYRSLSVLAVAIGLLAMSAIAASAGTVNISVGTQCFPCTYSITVFGEIHQPGLTLSVHTLVNFTSHTTGITTTAERLISVTGDANGQYSVTVPDIPSPVDCTDTFDVSADASLTFPDGFTATGSFSGETFGACTPPPGKTFGIGPSSMEGALSIRPGDWISGGYSFKFVSDHFDSTTFTVTASVQVPFTCPNGGGPGGTIFVSLGTKSYFVFGGNNNWLPTGDANSILSWDGAAQAPDGCSGNVMVNRSGAIFSATVSQNPPTGSLVNWRFKYRDPNAKGKGNVNCTDSTDPRRDKADVCGASWSETVRDP